MKIIITGGTGLIGSYLTNTLVQNGHRVIILTRNANKHREMASVATLVGWNARTAEGWGHLVDTCDAIVNLVGEDISGSGFFPARWTESRKKVIRESRINAGAAITQAVQMANRRPSVLIQSSGVSIYGPSGDEVVTEEHAIGSTFMARLGQDWEESTKKVEQMGVRRAIVRSAVNLSATSGALPRMLLPFRLYAGGPMGNGRQYMPWIHPQDEAEAIYFLITRLDASGPFNLTAPEQVTNAEFGKTIARLLHRPYWFPIPGFAMRLAFGEVSSVVLTGQRVVPRRLQQMGFKFRFPDLESALADILKVKIDRK